MKPWTSTFEDAELRRLEISLAATPEQRLDWLEQAQLFALESGAQPADTPKRAARPSEPDASPESGGLDGGPDTRAAVTKHVK